MYALGDGSHIGRPRVPNNADPNSNDLGTRNSRLEE